MIFWILITCVGLIGAISDIVLNQWSKSLFIGWWAGAAVLFLAFMTAFGLSMRFGLSQGYSLTMVVVVVLVANIAGVAIWEIFALESRFSSIQWLGIAFAVSAIIFFELGKKSI
jgi:hypothetical protein